MRQSTPLRVDRFSFNKHWCFFWGKTLAEATQSNVDEFLKSDSKSGRMFGRCTCTVQYSSQIYFLLHFYKWQLRISRSWDCDKKPKSTSPSRSIVAVATTCYNIQSGPDLVFFSMLTGQKVKRYATMIGCSRFASINSVRHLSQWLV